MYTYTYMHTRIYTHTHICTHIYTHTHRYIHTNVYIYIYIYIYILWRGNMKSSNIRRVMGKEGVTHWPSGVYSWKQNSGNGRAVSLQPSQIKQSDIGMRNFTFQLCMHQQREPDLRPWFRRKTFSLLAFTWIVFFCFLFLFLSFIQ